MRVGLYGFLILVPSFMLGCDMFAQDDTIIGKWVGTELNNEGVRVTLPAEESDTEASDVEECSTFSVELWIEEDLSGYLRSISQSYRDGVLEFDDTYDEQLNFESQEENTYTFQKEEGEGDSVQWVCRLSSSTALVCGYGYFEAYLFFTKETL